MTTARPRRPRRRSALGATGISRRSSELREEGGRLAALFPESRALAIEAAVIAGLIVLVAFLVYHFTVHKIVNHRPLGGANVDVSSATADQSEAAFAIDPADAKRIFGASNDTGLEVVRLYESGERRPHAGRARAAPPSPAARAPTAHRPSRSAPTGASTSRSSPRSTAATR